MSLERHRRYIEQTEASAEYWHEAAVVEFTEDLSRLMEEKQVSRAELARRLGTSRAYSTKLLSGDANFTLMTMARLAQAVDGAIHVHIADRRASRRWVDEPPKAPPEVEAPADVPARKPTRSNTSSLRKSRRT